MKAKLALGAALVLGAGCSFPMPSDGFRCEITADCEAGRVCDQGFCVVPGGVDAQPPPSTDSPGTDPFDCTAWTPAPRHFMPCDLPRPLGALVLDSGSYTYDTTSGTLSGPSNVAIASKIIGGNRVISVERLSLGAGATLRVTGSQPLVVASWGALDVSGTIDASSGTSPGAGGNGGGAVQLTARQSITITGRVHAGGAGGGGATGSDGAGGGGGSGGMIGLESPSVAVRSGAVLAANGGGGGQGANAVPGGAGQPGAPSGTPAAGGTGGDSAPGGNGSAGTTLGGNVGRSSNDVGGDGGGGGGGGAGYITIKSASRQLDTGAVISPPSSAL